MIQKQYHVGSVNNSGLSFFLIFLIYNTFTKCTLIFTKYEICKHSFVHSFCDLFHG